MQKQANYLQVTAGSEGEGNVFGSALTPSDRNGHGTQDTRNSGQGSRDSGHSNVVHTICNLQWPL